ncbi:MAG: ammonia-forming cytochrome c nitrite reductase subunit c552, partial [Bacteroidales bacterium]|nr:ammonia-forming cytochrome c nitrite reductase subunit c552 [Bacteroidales bacterium]
AWDAGATEEMMKPALSLIRQAQWRWDFTTASHGASFHAPLEVASILGNGIIKALDARIELTGILMALGAEKVTIPDITSKSAAQRTIGLDMEKLIREKEEFKNEILPLWDKTVE